MVLVKILLGAECLHLVHMIPPGFLVVYHDLVYRGAGLIYHWIGSGIFGGQERSRLEDSEHYLLPNLIFDGFYLTIKIGLTLLLPFAYLNGCSLLCGLYVF